MWQDNETTEDLIGFEVHAELIKSLIIDESLLPLTVGLFGDWGNGKTSVMRMLESKFEDEDDSICIYFNGWLFEGYDDAKSAILSSIVLQLLESRKSDESVKDLALRLLSSIRWMRFLRMGTKNVATPLLRAYLTGGTSLLPEMAIDTAQNIQEGVDGVFDKEKFEKMEFANFDPMDVKSFRDKFQDLIEATKFKRLIILVDDLDRCSPDRLIDNLEAIKLFLNVNNTAFVIGADPRIIRFSISTRYNISEISDEESEVSANDLVRDYLEKLIQIPYHLPKLSPSEVETYMVLLFSQKELSISNYHEVLKAYKDKLKDNRYSRFTFSDVKEVIPVEDLSEEYQDRLTFIVKSSELITEGLKGNPRQVKRFLNAFILRKKLATTANLSSIRDEVLVKLMILEYVKPNMFKQLFQWQAIYDGFPPQVKQLEGILEPSFETEMGDAWEGEIIKKWIDLDPPLSEVDLRDYFWIARDRLESTLSNLSLVSPFIKQLYQKLVSGIASDVEATVLEISSLQTDDQEQIFELLKTKVQKEPDKFNNYQAFRFFGVKKLKASYSFIIETLDKINPKDLPPALAVLLRELLDSFEGEHKERLQALIEKIKESDSKISKALKTKEK